MANKTIKQMMIEEFDYSLWSPLLFKYVDWDEVLSLPDGEKIPILLIEGKWDDGLYYLERRGGTLYFYRFGCFNKIVIANESGVYSYTPKQYEKARASGVEFRTQKFPRFYANR